jgi:hypothetical protein
MSVPARSVVVGLPSSGREDKIKAIFSFGTSEYREGRCAVWCSDHVCVLLLSRFLLHGRPAKLLAVDKLCPTADHHFSHLTD